MQGADFFLLQNLISKINVQFRITFIGIFQLFQQDNLSLYLQFAIICICNFLIFIEEKCKFQSTHSKTVMEIN